MNLSVGIVGLPNVGKSTLFNALLKKQQALAANYPFATIEPNVGVVPVPDARLLKLAEIVREEENPSTSSGPNGMGDLPPLKPAMIDFIDIAGLVKGASEGAGLGNKFLSHIREVTVIAHVVRAFEDPDVVREGSVSPADDYQTIQMELIFADLQTLQRVVSNRKNEAVKLSAAAKLMKEMNQGVRAYDVKLTDEERESVKDLFLLSNKPEIIVLNVTEDDYKEENLPAIVEKFASAMKMTSSKFVVICAKVESELVELTEEDQKQYLTELGVSLSGLERLIQKAYEELGLISFLTAGEKEVRAWTIKKGEDAQHAAGAIHNDFVKKFIKAEVISFDDYVATGGRKKAREAGKARQEGRDYIVNDGDVIEFKIGT